MATKNSINSNIPIEISKGGTNATSMATTDGVAYYDGSKVVVTSAGTSTYVLTSNGPSSAPTYQDAAGLPGALEYIATYSGSGGASINITSGMTYNSYMLLCINVVTSNNGDNVSLRVSTDGGTVFRTTNYQAGTNTWGYNDISSANNGSSTNQMFMIRASDPGLAYNNAVVFIYNFNVSGVQISMNVNGTNGRYPGTDYPYISFGGATHSTGTINGLQIINPSGNIDSGDFILYGITQ